MSRSATRMNETLLRYLAAAVLASVTWLALRAMPFYAPPLELLLALATGAIALFSPATASLLFIGVLALPILAADFVVGVLFVIAALIATEYLSVGTAGGFLLAVIGLAAIPLHAEWAVAAVAGYLLGRGRGIAATVTVCVSAVVAGIILGAPTLGSIATGGTAPGIVTFSGAPDGALTFGWLLPAARAADPARLFETVMNVENPLLLAGQVVLWALAAVVGALFRRKGPRALGLVGTAAAVGLLAGGSLGLDAALSGPVATGTFLTTLAVSLPVALVAAALATWVFPMKPTPAAAPTATSAGERDVDDLLRTIACAEDELATRHHAQASVLITDMKSFSAMTEEIGSVESAKIVQRHRDLLLPVIAAHHGRGTPTGGDGLVAAFSSPADAAAAAIAMQRTLDGYTGSDRSPHELAVRIGVASGDVVVDAAGCPFLGNALNLAARVMDLADGGHIMTTGAVADSSNLPPESLHAHGEFKLKNIADVVPVVEILWREGETPQEIRA